MTSWCLSYRAGRGTTAGVTKGPVPFVARVGLIGTGFALGVMRDMAGAGGGVGCDGGEGAGGGGRTFGRIALTAAVTCVVISFVIADSFNTCFDS